MKILLAILLFVSSSFAIEWHPVDETEYFVNDRVITRSEGNKIVDKEFWVKSPKGEEFWYINCMEMSQGDKWYRMDPISPSSDEYKVIQYVCDHFTHSKKKHW